MISANTQRFKTTNSIVKTVVIENESTQMFHLKNWLNG